MSQTRFSEFAVFFDDGGVMNDNRIRGLQYQKLVGEYFTPKFGGEPYLWAESNVNFIEEIMKEYSKAIYDGNDGSDIDYKTYHADFVKRWVEEMFNYVGVKLPAKSEYNQIYREAIEYITPNVRSTYPGVVDSIKKLKRLGFNLYTASAEDSLEIKGYLQGMRVRDLFENFYGPDLVNTHKTSDNFFKRVLDDVWFEPDKTIVIEDKPRFLEYALNSGANVIQACLTGDFEPSYQYYVKDMNELPKIITDLVSNIKNK
ncbi:MAG: HAD family hydrolase [Candidatus Heimdallarchaeaceae archaeon]